MARLEKNNFDFVVAGAGLAAALPGVCAAKVPQLVFGVPVAANYGGLDSLASIVQMPFGVPVVTCGPGREGEIVRFLNSPQLTRKFGGVNLVMRETYQDDLGIREVAKAREYAHSLGLELKVSPKINESFFNVVMVRDSSDILKNEFCLHVPLLGEGDKNDPTKILDLFFWCKEGGLWVGTNNTKNAILSAKKLFKE
jgi:5-(carboxyamino)imidazole ribonucleotide mutase